MVDAEPQRSDALEVRELFHFAGRVLPAEDKEDFFRSAHLRPHPHVQLGILTVKVSDPGFRIKLGRHEEQGHFISMGYAYLPVS
jgi:hypothetical protein